MESLMSASNLNQNLDNSRRSSTPSASSSTPTTTSGGGFSSIFNLKSVISAATKTAQPQQQHSPVPTSTTTSFHMPQPITTLADQSSLMESHANSTNISQKPVQGRLNQLFCSVCSRLRSCGCNCF
jgi:hypothetical protein